ncbi:MAG: ATP-binding protein, partial [candidate division Zixibacteria bacterium]|nr:ATP-binding protein [candidate division Zixibacteria bacterium]
ESIGVADYYKMFLYARIDSALINYSADLSPNLVGLDFLVFRSASADTVLWGDSLVQAVTDDLWTHAGKKGYGMFESEHGLLQYKCRLLGESTQVCGGFFHLPDFARVMGTMQREQAGRSAGKDLRPRYLLFLASLFLLVGAVTLVVAYIFSARLARSLSRPLTQLSVASKEIAQGRFGQTVPPAGVGEIRSLIDNFNRMSRRLEFTTNRLAQSERVAAWRSVARRFAHELKNPLQPIMISLHRLHTMLADSEQHTEAAEPLRAASEELKHLVELADRFAQLAKLPEPTLEMVDLTELLESIATLYRDRMEKYQFEVDLQDRPVTARIDPTYFREALHNLLQNAADASSENGRIRLALCLRRDEIDIAVEDFGSGMSEEIVTASRLPGFTTKTKGKGLGLAVVEKVVTEIGGRLSIDSQQGRGTRITITLRQETDTDAAADSDN